MQNIWILPKKMTNFAADNHGRMRAAIYKVFAVVAQMWFKTKIPNWVIIREIGELR